MEERPTLNFQDSMELAKTIMKIRMLSFKYLSIALQSFFKFLCSRLKVGYV